METVDIEPGTFIFGAGDRYPVIESVCPGELTHFEIATIVFYLLYSLPEGDKHLSRSASFMALKGGW